MTRPLLVSKAIIGYDTVKHGGTSILRLIARQSGLM